MKFNILSWITVLLLSLSHSSFGGPELKIWRLVIKPIEKTTTQSTQFNLSYFKIINKKKIITHDMNGSLEEIKLFAKSHFGIADNVEAITIGELGFTRSNKNLREFLCTNHFAVSASEKKLVEEIATSFHQIAFKFKHENYYWYAVNPLLGSARLLKTAGSGAEYLSLKVSTNVNPKELGKIVKNLESKTGYRVVTSNKDEGLDVVDELIR